MWWCVATRGGKGYMGMAVLLYLFYIIIYYKTLTSAKMINLLVGGYMYVYYYYFCFIIIAYYGDYFCVCYKHRTYIVSWISRVCVYLYLYSLYNNVLLALYYSNMRMWYFNINKLINNIRYDEIRWVCMYFQTTNK